MSWLTKIWVISNGMGLININTKTILQCWCYPYISSKVVMRWASRPYTTLQRQMSVRGLGCYPPQASPLGNLGMYDLWPMGPHVPWCQIATQLLLTGSDALCSVHSMKASEPSLVYLEPHTGLWCQYNISIWYITCFKTPPPNSKSHSPYMCPFAMLPAILKHPTCKHPWLSCIQIIFLVWTSASFFLGRAYLPKHIQSNLVSQLPGII